MKETRIRTLIVDDEKYTRCDLRELLSVLPAIEVVGEAKNINEAVDTIESLQPDLIFLDIQFPGETGFDLFERTEVRAKVIFITAYDEFAIRAFDVNACDYLLKPVNPDRLNLAVKRIQEKNSASHQSEKMLTADDSVYIQLNYKYYFVKIKSIIKITASDQYTEILTINGLRGLTNKHLWEWQMHLPENLFIQVHRSTLININFVEKIERGENHSYQIRMQTIVEPITISRRFASKIKKRLSI